MYSIVELGMEILFTWSTGPQAAEVFFTVLFSSVVSWLTILDIYTAFSIYNIRETLVNACCC